LLFDMLAFYIHNLHIYTIIGYVVPKHDITSRP
jgi:hypothetical protein